nr:protein kinase [Polyangiaceae bacterium]
MSNPPTLLPAPVELANATLAGAASATTSSPWATESQAARARRSTPPLTLDPGTFIKHYEIVRLLGQGGMGEVYLARDTKLGRLVAIKRLLGPSSPGAESSLVEARATARCQHENIVVIYEVDEYEGSPYLVLEYVAGPTLRVWAMQRAAASLGAAPEQVPPGLAVELMLPVVRALAYAHEQGIVHRDLKPENILLADAGPIKVVDFGLAKHVDQEASGGWGFTNESGPRGTVGYMAPEQWRGEDLDARVDLWAVGVILYELCAGAHPLLHPALSSLGPPGSPPAPTGPAAVPALARALEASAPVPSLLDACPDAGALAAVVDRCLQKRRDDRFRSAHELLAALEALRAGRPSWGGVERPYLGLSAFQEADAGRFFGRDADITNLARAIYRQPLIAVVGASGAGKSSLVRAGVIPALKRSGERWDAWVVRPGRRPLAALAEVLARVSEAPTTLGAPGPDVNGLAAALRERPGAFGAELRLRCRRLRGRALLFVDQFEELYTLGADSAERAAFLACLESVADDASSPLRVLLALRADFLERLVDERSLLAEVARGLWALTPPDRAGLREALTRPLEAGGHHFESTALVDEVLAALEGTRNPLPLLQFVAEKLWEARDPARAWLTEASYEALGGVAGALAAHADAVVHALPAHEQRLCRDIFVRLVTPERTRAVVSLEELSALENAGQREPDRRAIERVVQHLVEARLLTLETGGDHPGATVELMHESLLERWPRLSRWLDDGAQSARFEARLRAAAQTWASSGEPEGLLWREGAALEARAFWARRQTERGAQADVGLGEVERRYLHALLALSDRAQRRRRRALAGLALIFGTVAATVSFLAMDAHREARRADTQAALAQAEARQARNATRLALVRELLSRDPTTALGLARELEPPNLPRGWSDLARAALEGGVSHLVVTHPERVQHAAFSPDGRWLVTASVDGLARVVRTDGPGEPLVLRGHGGLVSSAVFSPDGRSIVTASWDHTARVFRADGQGEPLVLRGHEGEVNAAAFSPDGLRVVTASADGTARVFRADGQGEPLVLRGHGGVVYAAAFSPDGRSIVSASADGTARVWPLEGTSLPVVLRGHAGEISAAAFSPDGLRVVTASTDGTARVFRANGEGEPLILRGHEGRVSSANFSPDGRSIVTASEDKSARVFRADGQGEPLVLRGHQSWVSSASFSPDGHTIVTTSWDATARLWRAESARQPLVLRGHEGEINAASFSPDGQSFVTASQAKVAQIWREASLSLVRTLRGHEGKVYTASFSPDGRLIVTASRDKTARIFRADGAGEPLVLRGHEGRVNAAAFSPDGLRVVTASDDKSARVWRADGQGEPLVLRGHESWVYSASFSPDGRSIVTTSEDRSARVFRAD